MTSLQSYMDHHFKGLTLAPALFYSSYPAIRYEITNPTISLNDPVEIQLKQAFHRSITLFDEVFRGTDEMMLITDVHTSLSNSYLRKKPLNVYLKYVKQRDVLTGLRHEVIPDPLEEEENQRVIHRFSLLCKKGDIRYQQLLQAICYEDFAHPSTILKNNPSSGVEVYFINVTGNLIYHLYDDRGCDILAADKHDLRFLYETYNDWILDYDRNVIDETFHDKDR
ncbi:DUF3885 domain-containing protein [Sporosarcina aquimarina]|uniref:DUF3885 domain-containing protein n=1 Tax=Sporosarcina aquimarina TaxID=114975 RepID=UPI00203D30D7|nr:DUF3885 domain-containing protein [Sporosarcina aquimarina]MCM3758514.1 DUF3885 domain-containing protein [Sporosarcina aquimarina]